MRVSSMHTPRRRRNLSLATRPARWTRAITAAMSDFGWARYVEVGNACVKSGPHSGALGVAFGRAANSEHRAPAVPRNCPQMPQAQNRNGGGWRPQLRYTTPRATPGTTTNSRPRHYESARAATAAGKVSERSRPNHRRGPLRLTLHTPLSRQLLAHWALDVRSQSGGGGRAARALPLFADLLSIIPSSVVRVCPRGQIWGYLLLGEYSEEQH